MKIRKAVIPAAGVGTRMLPFTKTVPKELLPLVDKPVLHFIVQEAVDSGVEDVILITSPGKTAMDDYFRPAPELEAFLRAKGKDKEADAVKYAGEMARFTFVEQAEQRGLGHAVWCARDAVGDEPFGILLGDDIMANRGKPVLRQLIEASEEFDCGAIACREVDDEHVVKYSSLKISPLKERVYRIHDMNEKPTLADKLSNHAILGRYVLIQLTDGMRRLCAEKPMVAVDFEGTRYDTGNPKDYITTFMEFALADPEAGGWARDYILKKARELQG